jgi:transcriptional regulator with XRE-family HTH domain/Zn-dependent peptidase ImmA (M78 family)
MAKHKFEPDYAVPPGATLKEVLDSKGMSQADLCLRTGLAEKTVSQIVNGVAPISFETAEKFELATGVPASFWNAREVAFRQAIAQADESQRLAGCKKWLNEIPVKELIARGLIAETRDSVVLVRDAFRFFEVSSVESWRRTWTNPAAQYRGRSAHSRHPGFVAAWLRMGEISAAEIECEPFDAKRFSEALRKARDLTMGSAKTWPSDLRDLFAPTGVAVVFVKEIPRAGVSGVARWLSKDKALIQVSLKFKSDDQLWFSFFHEAGHILLHGKRKMFVEYGRHNDTVEEKEANDFARDLLIPPDRSSDLARLKTKRAMKAFAQDVGVSPGIVVGRLQFDGLLPLSHCNDLKRKIVWG